MCACVHGKRGIYFKGLAQGTVEIGKPKICRVDQESGDPGRADAAAQVQGHVEAKSLFLAGGWSFGS